MNDKRPDPTAPPEKRSDNRGFDIKSRLQYFIIRCIIGGLGRAFAFIPERWAYGICIRISLYAYKRLPKFRKLARKHLEIAFGNEKSPEEIEKILHDTYVNYGMSLAEFLMLPHKSREWVESKVVFDDPKFVTRACLEKGNGVVGLGAHFGSWEMVNARLGIYHYKMALIVKAQRDAIFSRLLMETRTKWGNEYVFKSRGIKEECYKQLKQDKIIGLLADQNATRNGVFVDFFGKKASTVTGPAEIAMKSGAPIVPSFPARGPDGTITLYVFDALELRDTGDFEAHLVYNTQLFTKSIEDFARAHPSEYFWWHRRWATRPPEELENR